MKYILPLLLLLSACTPDTKTTTDAASAPKTHGFAHRLTEGEKLLTQALIKQDLAAYFKHETGGAFAEQAPLFSAQQLAEQKNIPQNDVIGVYGKIIKTQGRTAWLQTDKQTLKLDLAEPLQEAEGEVTLVCQHENTAFQDCQTEANFARRFTEQIFSAVESGRVSAQTDAPAEEIMAGRLIPFLSAASDFTGNFKACATTMTEYCTSRLAREMPESAVRKKAQELGLTEIAFKKKK
ncbi:hypothetical protein [uncultured Neisseria sp.]|uniref:hypothetical protein n=1 Tax=uncultured Neisseria sp. TaxID=237778 RepID=UPI0025D58486|nr:hypothetical protein [uncultured Neisseria sp.]